MSWNCALENGAVLCVNEGQMLSECRVSLLKKKKEEERSIFDRVWFSMKTAILESAAIYMYTGSISNVDNDSKA